MTFLRIIINNVTNVQFFDSLQYCVTGGVGKGTGTHTQTHNLYHMTEGGIRLS